MVPDSQTTQHWQRFKIAHLVNQAVFHGHVVLQEVCFFRTLDDFVPENHLIGKESGAWRMVRIRILLSTGPALGFAYFSERGYAFVCTVDVCKNEINKS